MKTFLKIIFLLVLLTALTLVTVYSVYKDELLEKVRVRLSSELSELLQRPVHIGSVEYIPLQSISLNHITISAPHSRATDEPGRKPSFVTPVDINKITLTAEALSFIKDKQLKTTITIDGLHAGDILCNATIRTISHKADTYREALRPSMIDSVSIIEGFIATKALILRDIFGILKIDNMAVSEAKIHFTHNNVKYLTSFIARADKNQGYNISIRSDNLNLQASLTKNDNYLAIENLNGTFYVLHFDLKGELRNCFSPKMLCALDGTAETDLEAFAALPGKTGAFARNHPMSGVLKSHINLKTKELNPGKYEGTATVSANNLRIGNLRIGEITTKMSLKDGRLSAPLINGALYDGLFVCRLKMDLMEENVPYLLSLTINNMSFRSLMRDITKKKTNLYGTLNMNLSLEGYADVPETATGGGSLTISKADLGPMPILTPLLGNIFSTVRNILPGIKRIEITEAHANFNIKNRRITTDDLTLLGEDIYITSKGYLDFDGNLDFVFQNQFRQPPSDRDENWQTSLRNAIIHFGKLISKAHLRGTLNKPKWEFEYLNPIKNLIGRNIRKFLGTFE